MSDPAFIILGAGGDLAKRMLFPSIHNLIADGKLGDFKLIGASLDETDMQSIILESKNFITTPDEKALKKMSLNSRYVQMDFGKKEDYGRLGDALKESGCSERIFHLAVPPQLFDPITRHLSETGVVLKDNKAKTVDKVVYEKPFGDSLEASMRLQDCVERVFTERQVYRLDHFLGEDLVENTYMLRFGNRMLETLWSRDDVACVEVLLLEDLDVSDRGSFYDKYGAIKDVVQNHMLQLLALTAMEPPENMGIDLRNKKKEVLERVNLVDAYTGQYGGYHDEEGVDPKSRTETYALLELEVETERWREVPFILATGKALKETSVLVRLTFKKPSYPDYAGSDTIADTLTINVYPEKGFKLALNALVAGGQGLSNIEFTECSSCDHELKSPKAYEKLYQDVVEGRQARFVGLEEILESWRIINQANKLISEPAVYEKGSQGPEDALKAWSKIKARVKP